jgi:plastocyanin
MSTSGHARTVSWLWAAASAALGLGMALALLTSQFAAAAAPVAVSIQHHMYMPADVTVPAGTTVTWTNEDGAIHTVTSDAKGQFSSGWKTKGGRYSFTFARPGTYPYHCSLHKDMHGTVTVTG